MIIRIDNSQASTRLDLWGGTSGVFTGIDRFGRVVDQRWQNNTTSTPADIDRYQYGYDRDSNRVWKQNTTATGLDEFYAYDALNRLTQMQRGTLNGTKTGITGTPGVEQDWGLDPSGNWGTFQTKASGTTNLNQTRTANPANEITAIAGTPAWATPPGYDAAGNMTSFPQPATPANAFGAVYDAWNRLVKVTDSSGTVSTYQYDGQGRRITKTTASETRHYYYTSQWQNVEERVGSSTTADVQYVWGLRYVDELICRDDPTNGRLFACQDANFNLTAITDTSGVVQERYNYTPYGVQSVFSPSWASRSSSSFDWAIGHQGLLIDEETQLIYNRFRYLHPVLGRYSNRDDFYHDGYNLYEYGRSSPVDSSDPTGHETTCSATDQCGPDVTGLLITIAADVARQFENSWFWTRRSVISQTIGIGATNAWDIDQLFNSSANNAQCGSGSGGCGATVTVANKCYRQIAVNYFLAGVMYFEMLSSGYIAEAQIFESEVADWVGVKGVLAGDPIAQKISWFKAGARLNPYGVPADSTLAKCGSCSTPPRNLSWHWSELSGVETLQ